MKISWGRESLRRGDRAAARSCLVLNLLCLPGLGSFLAGRWVAGALQMSVALAGFVLTLTWLVGFLAAWNRTGTIPLDDLRWLCLGLVGVGLFLSAWCWALATSRALLRQARR